MNTPTPSLAIRAIRQLLFDVAFAGLWAQGKTSRLSEDLASEIGDDIPSGMCAYRGADNCKCAVGHLIPDERYTTALEGRSCCSGDVLDALALGSALQVDTCLPDFLRAMQIAIHDTLPSSEESPDFHTALARATVQFALRQGLAAPTLASNLE